MRICFLAGTLARGGAEKQLVFMLEALKKSGAAARVLSLTKGEDYENEIQDLNIPVEWVGKSRNRGRRVWEIVKNLRENPADIVQSSHFYTNIYAGLAGKILGKKSIGAVRSDLSYEMQSHQFLGKWQISLPEFLIANSSLAYRRIIERGIAPQKVEIVRNVVKAERCGCAKTSGDTRRVLFAGRLDRNKRPEKFIKLAARIFQIFPEKSLKFQIAGDGILRESLEKTAKQMNLTPDKIEFSGVCRDMREVYANADLLVSTSESEGTPNVILEAMAHGLPIVATGSGDTPQLLADGRGISVDSDSESQLVNAVAALLETPDLRRKYGENARKYVLKYHSLENLQTHLPAIYGKLLSSNQV